MTGTTRRRRVLWLLAPAAAALVLVAPAAGTGRYTDPTGDAGAAPDITGVNVSSDGAGRLEFTIAIADLPSPADVTTLLFLNTDLNPATGGPDLAGADYVFAVSESDNSYSFGRWSGTDWDWGTPFATVNVSSGRRGVSISVNRSELGGTNGLNFWARTVEGDGGPGATDTAPEDGTWNYSLAAGGPEIDDVVLATVPAAGPRAGAAFTVRPTGLRLPADASPGAPLPAPERYSCRARLAGRLLASRGVGGCTFSLPKKARGKRLSVQLTVAYQGASKSVTLSFRVR